MASLGAVVLISSTVVVWSDVASAAGPSSLYLESFQDPTVTSPISLPAPATGFTNQSCLTAGSALPTLPIPSCNLPATDAGEGVKDASGSGALRLTSNSNGKVGGSFYNASVSSTASSGLDLAFNVYEYGSAGTPADGVSFSLAAVDPALALGPTNLGVRGGNLGYNGHGPGGTDPGDGMSHGYLGIGFDSQGNYSNAAQFDSTTCNAAHPNVNPSWATPAGGTGLFPESVTVRGPGHKRSGYCMLNSSLNDSSFNNPDYDGLATTNVVTANTFRDGVANGTTTFTSATANFTSADVGAPIMEIDTQNAIAASGLTYTTIAAVNSSTSVTLSAAATAAVSVDFYISRTRIYDKDATTSARGAGTAVEIAINPTAAGSTTAGKNGLTAKAVPAFSYLVTFKPRIGGTQQTLLGALPRSANNLIPSGTIPSGWINAATGIPYQLSFGWTGSTGSNNQINEINLTSATSLAGAPPIYTLQTNDTGTGNFNGNYSGDPSGNVTKGTINFVGGLSVDGDNEPEVPNLAMTVSPGLQITGPATGTGWTCPISKIAADFADGNTTSASTTLTSAAAAFTNRDIGKAIFALDGQTAIPASTTIAAVTDGQTVTLSQAATATSTNANFGVQALSRYTDGASTTSSATLTSATAGFVAGDVGALLVETDSIGAIASQTKIDAVNSSSSVTLSKTSLVTGTGINFEVLRTTPDVDTPQWSASCTYANSGTLTAPQTFNTLALPVMVARVTKIVTPLASGYVTSLDGTAAYAAQPGISTNPRVRTPSPVFTRPFPQAGPTAGYIASSNSNSGLVLAELRGGNLDTVTSVTWGSATLNTTCATPPTAPCFKIATADPSLGRITVAYPSQTAAGSSTPSLTITNPSGGTGSGQPFTYYGPPTLVTVRGPANQSQTRGSQPATITGTNLTNTNTVYWGDGQVDPITTVCGTSVTPKWDCFDVVSDTEITVYPPGEVDADANSGSSVDFSTDPGTTPTQAAHTANVSLDTKITATNATVSFEDFGNYRYLAAPTATSPDSTGPQAGGTTVNIVGSGFRDGTTPIVTKISLTPPGGTATIDVTTTCSGGITHNCFTVVDNTHLTYYTPSSPTATVDTVRVWTSGLGVGVPGPSPGTHTYTPSPTAVGSGTGPTDGGTTVTITGSGLSPTSGITFGGTATTVCSGTLVTGCYVIDSATQIRVKSPAHAVGTVTIIVTVGGFGAITAGTFIYTAGGGTTTTIATSTPGPTTTLPDGFEMKRIGGNDRSGTAAKVAEDLFPDQDAPLVVLAREDIFADGLTGSPFAYGLGGPVLLTPTEKLAASTQEAITKVLKPRGKVIILGGTDAVSAPIMELLTKQGYRVERIGGRDRFDTAALIATRMTNTMDIRQIYLATGVKFGDAISAANVASLNSGVVLLTNEGKMPAVTDKWLDAHTKVQLTAVGAPATEAAPKGTPNVYGSTTYETSALVARAAFPQPNGVVVATGTTFPDALAGAVYAAFKKLPQILIDPKAGSLDIVQNTYLTGTRNVKSVVALGGPAAVPAATVELVRKAVTSH